jgi:O-antigen/teichoic acid export membrane protein
MIRACRRTAGRIFFFHSLLGLGILLTYPLVLRAVFPAQSGTPASFHVFSVLLPGLLYFGAASILEPVYTVQGKSAQLGAIALRVFLLNAFLNLYLVPHAGIAGAAAATSISLLIYFLTIGWGLDKESRLPGGKFLLAGAIVYLCYQSFSTVRMPVMLTLTAMVLTISVLFYLTGFFEMRDDND